MKKLVISIIFIITMIPAFAQIEDEIQQTKKVKIENGRTYLLEKFLERDYEKVKEIKDYLKGLEDDHYVALKPAELALILFWTSEFDVLAVELGRDSTDYHALNNKVLPVRDDMMTQIYRRSVDEGYVLRSNIQNAQLSDEDDDFFTIFLDWLLDENYSKNIEKHNERVDMFLTNYPNSRYDWLARHIIRVKFVEHNWGFGLGFNLCSEISPGFLPNSGFGVGFSLDVLYKKFDFTLGINMMTLQTTHDQIYSYHGTPNLICAKGEKCNWSMPYVNLGYFIIDNKWIALGPFVGLAYVYEKYPFTKDRDIHEDEFDDLNKTFMMYRVGVNCDIKLFGSLPSIKALDRSAVKLKYEFCLTDSYDGQLSTAHIITIGFSWIGRGWERVY